MKLNRLVLPIVLTLTALLATTGCKHNAVKNTPLPNHPAIVSQPENPPTLPSVPPVEPPPPPPVVTPVAPGEHPTANIDLNNFTQDREALAAYTVHFKYDSAVVEDAEQAHLASVAQALSDQNLKLLVEGHCDERGTDEYNRSLGERRALALREALAKIGVDEMRIKTISYGKDKPVDTGHDEAAWSKNRRGEFVLLHPKTPAQ